MARKKLTPDRYFTECRLTHNSKYDYRDSVYKGSQRTITYVCPKHGKKTQIANNHRSGSGCSDCGWERGAQRRSLGNKFKIKTVNKQVFNSQCSQFDYLDSEQPMIFGSHNLCPQLDGILIGNPNGEEYDDQHVELHMSPSEYPFVLNFRPQKALELSYKLKSVEKSQFRKNFNFIMIKFHQQVDSPRRKYHCKGSRHPHKSQMRETPKGNNYIESFEYHKDKFSNTFAKIRVSD